jgi:hypothetical protein
VDEEVDPALERGDLAGAERGRDLVLLCVVLAVVVRLALAFLRLALVYVRWSSESWCRYWDVEVEIHVFARASVRWRRKVLC